MAMSRDLQVVAWGCAVGCGFEVVLLKAMDIGTVFGHCNACGCSWLDPAHASFKGGMGPSTIVDPAQIAPRGVSWPSKEDVAAAGLASAVLGTVSEDHWGSNYVGELTQRILGEAT